MRRNVFKVNDKVIITRIDTPFHSESAIVVDIDGEYHLVKTDKDSVICELYRHEIKLIK